MNSTDFKKGLDRVLRSLGFQRAGKAFARSGGNVLTLVAFQKSSYGDQYWINVGFWLEGLGGPRPNRVERTHLYYRLDDLFPEDAETIVAAGDLEEPDQPRILVGDFKERRQRRAYQQLLNLFESHFDTELRDVGSEAGLRKAMKEGRLEQGLITKEAREWLRSANQRK